jgi:hypothetical protein
LSIQLAKHDISEGIKDIRHDNSNIRNVRQNLTTLLGKVSVQGPIDLRNFVLESGPSGPSEGQIVEKAKNQLDQIIKETKNDVVSPLKSLHNISLVNLDTLEAKIDNLSRIKDTMEFSDFRTIKAKGITFGHISQNIKGTLESTLDFGNIIKKLDDRMAKLNENLKVEQEKENNITSRINQIQFPFGNVPIGLDELISIFPIILAIGTTTCVFTLRDTITLRGGIDKWYQKKMGDNSVKVPNNLSLIAPIWINPKAPKLDQIIKFSVLLVPPLIFALIALYQISFGWSGEDIHKVFTFPGGRDRNVQIFTALYIIFSMTIAYSYWQCVTEFRRYRNQLDSLRSLT